MITNSYAIHSLSGRLSQLPVFLALFLSIILYNCTIQHAPSRTDRRDSTDCEVDSDCDANDPADSRDDRDASDATVGCADPEGEKDADRSESDVADTGGSIPDRSIDSIDSADSNGNATDSGRTDADPIDSSIDAEGQRDAESEEDADQGDTDSGQIESGAADASDAQIDTITSDSGESECPFDMVMINDFCIDIYEASRSDATSTSAGSSSLVTSRYGVIPWYSVTLAQARDACAAAGKRLCRPDEWFATCEGPEQTVYTYGNGYDPSTCNGIDSFCNCSAASCETLSVCPYPHCYNQASSLQSGGPCGASFHVTPTGSFPACTNAYGVFDINGNVWEIVDTNDGLEHFRGGAYNCSDSEALHRCDHDATWNPSAKGFRCCKDRDQR